MIPYVRPAVVESSHPFLRQPQRRSFKLFVDPLILEGADGTARGVDVILLSVVERVADSAWVELYTLAPDENEHENKAQRLYIESADDVIRLRQESSGSTTRWTLDRHAALEQRANAASNRTSVEAADWYDALLVLSAARAVGADLLVTDRANTLLGGDMALAASEFIVNRAEAVSFLGLLFREHEEWAHLPPLEIQVSRNEWLARRTAVLAMLDWEAIGHLGVVSPAMGDLGLSARAESLVKRMTTAVSIRDRICADAVKPASHGRAESIAAHLEWLSLTIAGAFDSLALTVNDHLGADSVDKRSVSWVNKQWREAAQKHCEGLIKVVQDQAVVTYLNLCKYLRDTIHDIGPSEFTGSFPGSRGEKLYVSLPEAVAKQCKKYAEGLGSSSSLGLVDAFGGTSFDPVTLADRLVDLALQMLNVVLLLCRGSNSGQTEAPCLRLVPIRRTPRRAVSSRRPALAWG